MKVRIFNFDPFPRPRRTDYPWFRTARADNAKNGSVLQRVQTIAVAAVSSSLLFVFQCANVFDLARYKSLEALRASI